MTAHLTPPDKTERAAKLITRCFSSETLTLVATELGVSLEAGNDIFRALIVNGKAADFDQAVERVAAHLDAGNHVPVSTQGLDNGKIERRRARRAGK